MKNPLILIASAISALLLPSCFQHETTITLNKDGSGTIVEETQLGEQMLGMMQQFAAGFGGEGDDAKAPDPLAEMLSEEKGKKRAAELGEGVTHEKSEPVAGDTTKGAKITYRFKDINQLQVKSSDGMKSMTPDQGAAALNEAAKAEEPISFSYNEGKLTVKMPKPKQANDLPTNEAADNPEIDDPQAMEMMKQVFADMKVGIKLIIEPGISETTASHQEGNTITLMEMNFGKLIENPENLKKIASMDEKDPTAAMAAFKGIDGVKFEEKPEITVELK